MSEKKKSIKISGVSDGKLIGRDTIYIDTEDDITSIIEKVKESNSSILALVPPKRVGALQSVVNLKLLQKAAKSGRKKIALVTTDTALTALAGGLRIPIARNLTSQPELPEAPDFDDSDIDVINGEEIAIGDLARIGEKSTGRSNGSEDKEISAAVKAIETDDKIKNDHDADGVTDNKPPKTPKTKRVPNFDNFRKKLLIFGSLGVALIIFLVWAIVFAPRGTITITAKTITKNVSITVQLKPNATTNVDNKVVQPTIKQIKRTESVDFVATGSKEIGEKAKGAVMIYNCNTPFNGWTGMPNAITLNAGTTLQTGSGLQFKTNETKTVAATPCTSGTNDKGVSFSVTAANIGTAYNIDKNTTLAVAGRGTMNAVASDDFTGGSQETVKVVQLSDLEAVTEKIKAKSDQNAVESDLRSQMGDDIVIISDSFNAVYGTINSKPALDEPAGDGSATATMEITYTLIGINKTDLKNLIEFELGDLGDQKIYKDGIDRAQFKNFAISEDGYSIMINVVAQIGPDLDKHAAKIKENAVGKRSGEITSSIETIPGVSSVKVTFWPFWVNSAPAANKLTVEFAVNEQ